jgi:N-glycosylase/DNA lyase
VSPDPWSDWRQLPLTGPTPGPAVLAETLDGGQAFRWSRVEGGAGSTTRPRSDSDLDAIFRGQWSDCLAEVRLHAGRIEWRAPTAIAPRVDAAIGPYFAGDRDFHALADTLPWRSDPHLAACLRAFPGLRLLHQPFGETLLGFLCSATKQIVQIKQMLALLAQRHGASIGDGKSEMEDGGATSRSATLPSPETHLPASSANLRNPSSHLRSSISHPPVCRRLPTWEALASIPERELRKCLLGFRAKFIHDTALFLAAHPGWLEATEHLPYTEAKERLRSLPGVGEKIADCVLLFGAGRLEAFPVDVWILRTMTERYGLHGWKPAQVAHFGRTHFGPLAGLAQQYLFAYERRVS